MTTSTTFRYVDLQGTTGPVSDAVLDEIEQRMGRALHPSHRELLRRHGGGAPERRFFAGRDVSGEVLVAALEWILPATDLLDRETLEPAWRDAKELGLRAELVPFGRSDGSALWCLDGQGRVVLVFTDGVSPVERALGLELDAFLEALTEDEDLSIEDEDD